MGRARSRLSGSGPCRRCWPCDPVSRGEGGLVGCRPRERVDQPIAAHQLDHDGRRRFVRHGERLSSLAAGDPGAVGAGANDGEVLPIAADLPDLKVVVTASVGGFLPGIKRFLGRLLGKIPKGKVTPLSRLIGGLLGAFNGYVILSLVRQYLIRYMGAKYQVYAVDQMSVSVTEMPASSVLAGPGIIFIFIVLIAVIALLIAGDRLKLPLK